MARGSNVLNETGQQQSVTRTDPKNILREERDGQKDAARVTHDVVHERDLSGQFNSSLFVKCTARSCAKYLTTNAGAYIPWALSAPPSRTLSLRRFLLSEKE